MTTTGIQVSSGAGHRTEEPGTRGTLKDTRSMAGPEEVSADIIHTDFRVEGNCEMCKERIETTARSVAGVQSAIWDMDNKILRLAFNKSLTSLETVQKAIAEAGHDNGKYRAPDEVYNNLPACCLYREGDNS
jgi:Cu(I)/Ag(I) efflux system membrane fusion protein